MLIDLWGSIPLHIVVCSGSISSHNILILLHDHILWKPHCVWELKYCQIERTGVFIIKGHVELWINRASELIGSIIVLIKEYLIWYLMMWEKWERSIVWPFHIIIMYRYMYVQWFFSPPLLQNLIPYTIYKVLSSISCENSVFTKKKVYMQYLVTLTAIATSDYR